MDLFSSLFSPKQNENKPSSQLGYATELHNHLLPAIDDGVQSIEESMQVIGALYSFGIRKIISTPHIKFEVFNNTPAIIAAKLEEVKTALAARNIAIEIQAAAEYFLDEILLDKIKSNEALLTFGDKHILFETSHVDACPFLTEAVFNLKLQGYKPIFAHPERYQYGFFDFSILERIFDSGVLFQLNINSLNGYYGKEPQRQAKLLIERGMVDFVGTDAHGMRHIETLPKSIAMREYQNLLATGKILNNQL
ncbi:MAG: tyrosine-protein phosphatase [Cytophagales bacterium]